MNRRSFLVSLLAVPIAATLPAPPALALHRDAFVIVMSPLERAKDAQRRYNYFRSHELELMRLTPRVPRHG